LNQENDAPQDYYLLPWLDLSSAALRLGEVNGTMLDGYRFDNLEYLYHMGERVKLRRAA
jgi:hypothetical protein